MGAGQRDVPVGCVHHRGLAGAGGAHDGGEFAGTEADAHVVEGAHLGVAASVNLGDALESDDGRGRGLLGGRGGLRDCRVRVHVYILHGQLMSSLRRIPLIDPRDHPGYLRGIPGSGANVSSRHGVSPALFECRSARRNETQDRSTHTTLPQKSRA